MEAQIEQIASGAAKLRINRQALNVFRYRIEDFRVQDDARKAMLRRPSWSELDDDLENEIEKMGQ